MPNVVIYVPGLPPTDNNAYATSGGHRRLSKKAKAWKEAVQAAYFEQTSLYERHSLRGALFDCHLRFYFDLRDAKGEMKRWDGSSHQKISIDAIASAMGSDDKNCMTMSASKRERLVGKIAQTQIELVPLGPAMPKAK